MSDEAAYDLVSRLLSDKIIQGEMSKWGFSNTLLDVQDLSQSVYNNKGKLIVVTLNEGKIVFKEQGTAGIEAKNLARKRKKFSQNYPQVYFNQGNYLFLEFIEGANAWGEALKGKPLPLDEMVLHIAAVHNFSEEQVRRGEINFKPKDYAEYCRDKFVRHLGDLVDFKFEGAYFDIKNTIQGKLKEFEEREHVDANLLNWIGLSKIDETNNTSSAPHFTLKSMLEYGPLLLDEGSLAKLYGGYCASASMDFRKFMEFDPYAGLVFHLNKIFRCIRGIIKLGARQSPVEYEYGLKRHISSFGKAIDTLCGNGHKLDGLVDFRHSILNYCGRRKLV